MVSFFCHTLISQYNTILPPCHTLLRDCKKCSRIVTTKSDERGKEMGWEWHEHNRGVAGRFAPLDLEHYVRVHIRLPAAHWEKVRKLALRSQMSISGYMAMIVDDHLLRVKNGKFAAMRPLEDFGIIDDLTPAEDVPSPGETP